MQIALIMGSGVCGALAYAWSDTFWFSAVEGEVYAFSSFCTALTFWLILKWENRSEEPHSDRIHAEKRLWRSGEGDRKSHHKSECSCHGGAECSDLFPRVWL